jgi:hypothetical protein
MIVLSGWSFIFSGILTTQATTLVRVSVQMTQAGLLRDMACFIPCSIIPKTG